MANGIVLNIDTTKSEFQNPMVQLRQGDGNYQSLSVTVTSNGEPFDLTGWTITFMGTTAGGFKIVDTALVVTNDLQGQFIYTPTKAWGQNQGEFKNAYFKFTKADETASGASFRVNVLDAVDLTAEEAKDYISVVDVMIDQVKTDMDTKLPETKQTLADTQSQANTVQVNVDDLNTNVNDLKAQNNNIRTSDNTWTGSNNFTKEVNLGNNISTTSENTMINGGGNNGDIAMVKRQGSSGFLGIGSSVLDGGFVVKKSNNPSIKPSDTFTDVFKVSYDGVVKAGTAQEIVPLDKNVVHKTGNETISNDKTFTGLTSITKGNSIAPITETITANGITVTFKENAFGVDVNILGTVVGSMVSDDQWKVFSYIPNNISIMKLNMYSNTVVTAPITGVTGKTNFKLMFSFNTNREIDYRLTSLRENDTATTYTPTFEVYSSLSWAK